MSAHKYAQQIEKADQRNVSCHDHQYPLRRPIRRISTRPPLELLRFEHLVSDRVYGSNDLLRQKPRILVCRAANDLRRSRSPPEILQLPSQCYEYVDHAVHTGQRYEKSSAAANVSLIHPRRSIYGAAKIRKAETSSTLNLEIRFFCLPLQTQSRKG